MNKGISTLETATNAKERRSARQQTAALAAAADKNPPSAASTQPTANGNGKVAKTDLIEAKATITTPSTLTSTTIKATSNRPRRGVEDNSNSSTQSNVSSSPNVSHAQTRTRKATEE